MIQFTIWMGIAEALSHAEFVNALGWVFAIAMMVGAILNDGGRRLISWSIAIATAVSLTESTRYVYWQAHVLTDLAIQGTALTLISTTVTLIGLAVGWFLAYTARQKARGNKLFPIHEEHYRRHDDRPDVNKIHNGG